VQLSAKKLDPFAMQLITDVRSLMMPHTAQKLKVSPTARP
jgi:hypothetical protein